MEVDNRLVAAIVASLVSGGGAGFGVTTLHLQEIVSEQKASVAKQQVQLDNMRTELVTRIAEGQTEHERLRTEWKEAAEDLGKRIDRLDDRKADK